MYLILFDIDGTLVSCGPQMRPLFGGALRDVYGATGPLESYDFSGKTDCGIVRELMLLAGLDVATIEARLPAMRALYLERLEAELRAEGMRLLPAAAELLAELAGREDVVLGLLTGNWEPGARIKLSRFGLDRYFAFGGFGDDGFERHQLVRPALSRAAAATGREFARERVLIVGDSLLDVACARAHDVAVVAVATGRTPAGELADAGADWVIPDLHAFHGPFGELVDRVAV